MRSTLPQSTPVRDRAGTGVNSNNLRKYSRCPMEMKFVANAETLTPRCSGAAFSTFIICRFRSPWIPVVACPRMRWSASGMTRGLVSALDTKPDCVVAVLLSMNPLKRPLATLSLLKKGVCAIKPGGTPSLPLRACHARSRVDTVSPANLLLRFQRKLTQFAFENFAIGIAR